MLMAGVTTALMVLTPGAGVNTAGELSGCLTPSKLVT